MAADCRFGQHSQMGLVCAASHTLEQWRVFRFGAAGGVRNTKRRNAAATADEKQQHQLEDKSQALIQLHLWPARKAAKIARVCDYAGLRERS